jgi:hypothetical protein
LRRSEWDRPPGKSDSGVAAATKASFLGILLFGRDRVPRWLHFLSACAVAIGTLLSAFWILSANSWMHTPAGHELRDGILPGTYLPLLIMLVALIFRGVAFEFRFKATRNRYWWDRAFHNGSLFATIAQGLVLGTYIQGFDVENRSFAGGMFDWLGPFSVLAGVALISGYALLGATWLIMKTAGPLQQRCYGLARRLLLAVLAFVGVVSVWTPLLDPAIAARWFGWPNIAYLSPVPVVTAAVAWWHRRSLERGREVAALRADHGAVPALVPWPRHQPVAEHRPAGHLDHELRVHDLFGLRVADASIMPTGVSGNTNAACIMIGKKCADLMLAAR